ncbi:MAG: DUF58 domain-containing protein [Bacteroidota bacterium]
MIRRRIYKPPDETVRRGGLSRIPIVQLKIDHKRMKHKLVSSFLFYTQFVPLKRNGFIFLFFTFLLFLFLRNEYYKEESQFIPFLDVFVWLLGIFAGFIIGFGLLYTLFCWLYLMLKYKKLNVAFSIGLEDGQKGVVGIVPVKLSLSKVIMPIIGYLKTWVVFEDGGIAGPVIVNKFSGGWRDLLSKEGTANLHLTKRAQYRIRGYLFSFEDYLQFFRFSFFKRAKKAFYLYSAKREVSSIDIPPSKAREELEKVKTSKRVEGDFLNYKDFESGDDVRRIVWKIFAKNKELVVRIPEVINPYASHINFFASFQNSLLTNDSKYATGMLDYYKDIIFSACLQIEKSGKMVEFSMDQVVSDGLIVDKKDRLAYFLSCAKWKSTPLEKQFNSISASGVVCVSSMVPADQLEELINKRSIILFIVRVSRYLDEQNLFSWANMILRKEKQSELSKLRWVLSPQRRKIKNNERKIIQLVDYADFQGQLI